MAQMIAMFLLLFLVFDPPSAVALPPRGTRKPPKFPKEKNFVDYLPANENGGAAGFQARLRYSGFQDYLLQLGVGTPASNVSLIIDTFDDVIWSDCLQNYAPSKTSAYYPKNSSTYITPTCDKQWEEELQNESCEQLPQCRYNCSGRAVGVLANDTFVFGGSTPRNLSFACNDVGIYNFSDTSGYVGLGRAPFSLISQLNLTKFSHCFTDQAADTTLSSYMFFGSYADLEGNIAVNTSTLLNDSTDYILDLKGISLGAKRLPIRPEMLQYVKNSDGTRINGTIIYSTDPFTYLPPEAYEILRDEVSAQVGLPKYTNSSFNFGPDLCFDWTSNSRLNLSTLTFHFDGADMTLPTSNFLANYTDVNGTSLVCLMIIPYNDGYSYLGNYQMQNFQYIYDLENGKLSFRSVQCDELQPPRPRSHGVKLDLHSITLGALLMLYLLLA